MTELVDRDYSTLAIVVPAYNEEEGITPTLSELNSVLNESYLIVVDGKSSDRTTELAKNLGAEVIIQNGNGKGNAISQGLEYLHGNINYVVFTDADYTYPAIHLHKMIEVLDKHPDVGMVLGNRFSGLYGNKSDRNQFYIGNKLLGMVQNIINGVKLNDPYTGLRVIRFKLLNGWKPKSKCFDIEAELNFHICQLGYNIAEIPILYRKRLGKKKLSFKHGLKILRRIVIAKLTDDNS
ncbi:MAG: glycosyltransferase family 2 protein [Candidatus Bathyarchaeota archaeon]